MALVEVPIDAKSFEEALLLFQPTWVRVGAYVAVFGVVFALQWLVPGWPREVAFVAGAVGATGLWGLRRLAVRRQVQAWVAGASSRVVRIELGAEGFLRAGKSVAWHEVTDAVEVDNALPRIALLGLRARGLWSVLPADHFTTGSFESSRSFLMRRIGDRLRVVTV